MGKKRTLNQDPEANKKQKPETLSPSEDKMARPGFNTAKKKAARLEATLAIDSDYTDKKIKLNAPDQDLAAPHRAPYSAIRNQVLSGRKEDVNKTIGLLTAASEKYEDAFKKVDSLNPKAHQYYELAGLYEETRLGVNDAHKNYKSDPFDQRFQEDLVKALNNLASNAPGLGPHNSTNLRVSDRLHLQPTGDADGTLTPRSKAAFDAFPELAIATTGVSGEVVAPSGAFQHAETGRHTLNPIPNLGDRVFRGSLALDKDLKLLAPNEPFKAPKGTLSKTWKVV